MSILQDFPICFAEVNSQAENNTDFYVEWLENNEEFPSLSQVNDLNGECWEVLKRKNDDNFNLIPAEEDWSNLTQKSLQKPYAEIAEQAVPLQPLKRSIQPLWPDEVIDKKKKDTKNNVCEDQHQYSLGEELIISQKGQSRRAARQSRKQQLRSLKVVDIHVNGILHLVTPKHGKTEASWHPRPVEGHDDSTMTVFHVQSKAQALSFSAKFTHNFKKYAQVYSPHNPSHSKAVSDNSEYSVQAAIVKKA